MKQEVLRRDKKFSRMCRGQGDRVSFDSDMSGMARFWLQGPEEHELNVGLGIKAAVLTFTSPPDTHQISSANPRLNLLRGVRVVSHQVDSDLSTWGSLSIRRPPVLLWQATLGLWNAFT